MNIDNDEKMAMIGFSNQDDISHFMTIDENGGQLTSKNSQYEQDGNTTIMQSQRAPTEMGYEDFSENIFAGINVDEKKPLNKPIGKFKSGLNESSDTQTFNSEFGEYCDK